MWRQAQLTWSLAKARIVTATWLTFIGPFLGSQHQVLLGLLQLLLQPVILCPHLWDSLLPVLQDPQLGAEVRHVLLAEPRAMCESRGWHLSGRVCKLPGSRLKGIISNCFSRNACVTCSQIKGRSSSFYNCLWYIHACIHAYIHTGGHWTRC